QCRAHLYPLDALDHGVDKAVMNTLGDDDAAGGGAALPRGIEGALGGELHRRFQVGVVENDLRVLAAHFQLDLGLACRAGCGNPATDAHGAGETDAIDAAVVDQHFADLAALAHHQVEHPGREARTGDDL